METFVVRHYGDTAHPIIKGNGFDGLTIGDYREEAQEFVDKINKTQSNLATLKRETSSFCKLVESFMLTRETVVARKRLERMLVEVE